MASIYGWSQPWITIFIGFTFWCSFGIIDKDVMHASSILCLSLYQIAEGGCYGVIPVNSYSPSRSFSPSVRTVWPAWPLLSSDWSLRLWLGLWLAEQSQDMRACSEVFQIIKSWELFENKHPNYRSGKKSFKFGYQLDLTKIKSMSNFSLSIFTRIRNFELKLNLKCIFLV